MNAARGARGWSPRERRVLDVKPYLDMGIFKELRDDRVFRSAHVSFGTVAWSNGADIDPEELYEERAPAPLVDATT